MGVVPASAPGPIHRGAHDAKDADHIATTRDHAVWVPGSEAGTTEGGACTKTRDSYAEIALAESTWLRSMNF
jgi:hypothetical protein